MIKIFYTIGLQGSGKTTWALETVKNDKSFKRINKDSIRKMLGVQWDKDLEQDVHKIYTSLIHTYLKNDFNIIIDNTGFKMSMLKELLDICNKYRWKNIEVIVKYFDTPLDICILRDKNRTESVGEGVIMEYYNKYINTEEKLHKLLERAEYIISLWDKQQPMKFEQAIQDRSKPFCVICDIDGTLADNSWRSPYDTSQCEKDGVIEATAEILRILYQSGEFMDEMYVILMSGRENRGGCLERTEKWLKDNCIHYDEIYMREQGDMRADNIVKYEMFKKYVEPKYHTLCVFDDRNSVVEMWRSIGLTCHQVEEGDF